MSFGQMLVKAGARCSLSTAGSRGQYMRVQMSHPHQGSLTPARFAGSSRAFLLSFYQILLPGELAACPQNTSTKPWPSRATRGLAHHHSPLSPQQQARSIRLWFGTTARNHLKTQPCPRTSSPHPFSLLLAQQGFRTPRPSRNPRSGLPELPSLTHCCCFGPADKRSQCQGLPACQDRTGNCGREN